MDLHPTSHLQVSLLTIILHLYHIYCHKFVHFVLFNDIDCRSNHLCFVEKRVPGPVTRQKWLRAISHCTLDLHVFPLQDSVQGDQTIPTMTFGGIKSGIAEHTYPGPLSPILINILECRSVFGGWQTSALKTVQSRRDPFTQ